MDTGHINGVFAPYGKNYILDTTHRIIDDDPICGQPMSEGEFLLSTNERDQRFADLVGVNLRFVTCKKCLKIMAKEIK